MSKIEVNTVAPQCGTTLTLGESGDTVTLGSGASQSGFGRTGTVDWQTTPKTGDFTGANGEGYFINTTSGEITMTLPSASASDIISIQDYNNTFDSNSFTIQAGSGVKINGGTAAGTLTLSTEGQGLTLIYVDATVGWRSIESTTFSTSSSTPTFITATGGTVTTVCTDYKVHTFTGPGTFTVCSVGNASGSNTVSYTVIAGGGGGGNACAATNGFGGGAGAGGYREGRTSQCNSWTVSPIACTSGPNAGLPVSAQGYPITIGAGGVSGPAPCGAGTNGADSSFSGIVSAGGGGGIYNSNANRNGGSGSGEGSSPAPGTVGAGNTPPVSPPQGNPGGLASPNAAGGGGGAGAVGVAGATGGPAGAGGAGATSSINGSPVQRAGGGGGGGNAPPESGGGAGGAGGGGAGGDWPASPGVNGTANTGGGGGATSSATPGGAVTAGSGGSGIVIIRYKFQ